MTLRDVIEVTPLLMERWERSINRGELLTFQQSRMESLLYLLLRSWERRLDSLTRIQPVDIKATFALTEEIVCCELVTVVLAALCLARASCQGRELPQGKIRVLAAEHAALRDLALERSEEVADHLSDLLRLERLRRRMSKWIDASLEPVLAHLDDRDSGRKHVASAGPVVSHRARTVLMMAGLSRLVPVRTIQDPYRAALLRDLLAVALLGEDLFRHES